MVKIFGKWPEHSHKDISGNYLHIFSQALLINQSFGKYFADLQEYKIL